jgi:phospholipid/cholesterol/gamma-HCH transport system substrate-binding protein
MADRNAGEIIAGAAVLLAAAGFLGYALTHSGRAAASGYPLRASFDHIDGLGVGADVKIAGVKVGSVTEASIDPKSFNAMVTLTVQGGLEVPKDSSAEVTSDGLLGGKYLSITPGGDATDLKPGDRIMITSGSVSLEQLLGKFIFSVTNMNNGGKKPEAAKPDAG